MIIIRTLVVLLAAAMLADESWRFEVVEIRKADRSQPEQRTPMKTTEQPEPAQPAAAEPQSEFYLVMFTASWCGPCQKYKSTTLPAIKDFVSVTETDMDTSPEYWRARVVRGPDGRNQTLPGVQSIPSFWLCRKSDRWPVARWTGPITPATLKAEITRQAAAVAAPAPAPKG